MRLSELIEPLHARQIGDDLAFERLTTDSRQLNAGDLFLALRGEKFDGHDFVEDVVRRGACGLVVEREIADIGVPQLVVADTTNALGQIGAIKRRQFSGQVIAITGSSGKTSVKGMLREILAVNDTVLATQGNFNNHIGVPLTLLHLQNEQFAVIEMGTNHPGEIGYLTSLAMPDVALVNNVMPAHIGGFGSLAAIAREKGEIYRLLQPQQTAVINLDDPFAADFIKATRACRQIGFALAPTAGELPTVYARNIEWDVWGRASFTVQYAEQSAEVQLRVLGQHNVRNALAAAACALAVERPLQQIAAGLSNFSSEKGRMQIYRGINQSCVVDDTYNANPGSVMAAIDYLSERPGVRILVLGDLGELGDLGPQAHRDLGHYAAKKNLSALFAVGPLAALSAATFGAGGFAFDEKKELVETLITQLNPNTTVLVKGSRSARMEEVTQLICRAEENIPC